MGLNSVLSQPKLDILYQELVGLGYQKPTGAIIPNYKFITAKKETFQANLIAFADSQRFDISTACVAVYYQENGYNKQQVLQNLRYIGTPLAIFARPDDIEIWPVVSKEVNTPQIPQHTLAYEELATYFGRYKHDLAPRAILEAKRKVRQLSFFTIDSTLESFARDATKQTLVEQFQEAIQLPVSQIKKNHPQTLTKMAIWVLAARVLQDKLTHFADLQTRDVFELLQAMQAHFPNYFKYSDNDLNILGLETIEGLYNNLLDFTFSSLTNDTLAYFYENTLVDKSLRQELSIYYTPRYISEYILKHLPLEEIAPEERTVLDGTCGSGNMLLAAYDRLSNLLPIQWTHQQRHDYLISHIWGIDKDPFACEVARLSLLLYNLPSGDSWQVKTGDVFSVDPQQLFGKKPNLIVGNPPFYGKQRQVEKAAKVLIRYLDWLNPGGYLGIVMPLSFLSSARSSLKRKQLLTNCDILEIIQLPERSIPKSKASLVIILAQKLQSSTQIKNHLGKISQVTSTNRYQFQANHQATISYLIPQSQWKSNIKSEIVGSQFNKVWKRIENNFLTIQPNFCILYNGIRLGKRARSTHLSTIDNGYGWQPILNRSQDGKTLHPHYIIWNKQKEKFVKYPSDEIEGPRNPEHFKVSPKLIINKIRNPDSPWRLIAAVDQKQLVVSENFHYILPKENITVEELGTVFNSMLANAWYSNYSCTRDITLAILKHLPFPQFTKEQKTKISELVSQISHLKQTNLSQYAAEIRHCIIELDEIVFDAYEVKAEERQQIKNWMNQFPRPGDEWQEVPLPKEEVPIYTGKKWVLTGEVIDINIDTETIVLDIEDEIIEVPIVPIMPGWLLRPNVAFDASIPWEQRYQTDLSKLTWLDFTPLGYSYLSDEELIALTTMHPKD